MKLKLFHKIVLILTLLATIPTLIVGWRTANLNKVFLENNILELHTHLAYSLSNRMDLYFNSLTGKVQAVTETMRLQGMVSVDALQAFINVNDEFISIAFVNRQGKELIKAVQSAYPEEKPLFDRSQSGIFKTYLAQQVEPDKKYEPAIAFNFENKIPKLTLVYPYNAEHFNQGAFYITISLAEFWETIANEGAGVGGGGRDLFVTDEKGFVIAHSKNPELAFNRAAFENHPMVAEALQKKSIGSKEYKNEQGRSMIGSYSRVNATGWATIVTQPKETAYDPIYQTRKSAMLVLLVSLFIAAWIAFLFARHLSRPILSLIQGAKKVSQREFSHAVQVNTNDELSDLAKTFNEMTRELKRFNDLQIDQLMEEKTKTESVIFTMADGIVLTDLEGNIQLLNEHAVKIFGLNDNGTENRPEEPRQKPPHSNTEKDCIGKNLIQILSNLDFKRALQELLSRPDSRAVKEISVATGDYRYVYQLSCELVYAPESKKRLGVVTVAHDISLERQMDDLKEGFLHSITHDLRNPMTSIMGFIKFLIDGVAGPMTDQQRQMLNTMSRASARLLGMINDILDIAKIEAGKLKMDLGPVSVPALIQEVVSLYQPLADRKSIRLQTLYPAGVKESTLMIQGDANQLERVVGNLVTNAIKFTFENGKITIAVEDFPDRLQISVIDNGPGIPEEYIEKVFDKFQQVLGQRHSGTGLGLTISKYFVELHKGKIWVESKVGEGSRFTFWIPKTATSEMKADS